MSCGGRDGSYLVAAIARRKLMMNNTIFTMRLPEVGTLVHPKYPDTTMFTSESSLNSSTRYFSLINLILFFKVHSIFKCTVV